MNSFVFRRPRAGPRWFASLRGGACACALALLGALPPLPCALRLRFGFRAVALRLRFGFRVVASRLRFCPWRCACACACLCVCSRGFAFAFCRLRFRFCVCLPLLAFPLVCLPARACPRPSPRARAGGVGVWGLGLGFAWACSKFSCCPPCARAVSSRLAAREKKPRLYVGARRPLVPFWFYFFSKGSRPPPRSPSLF